MSTSDSILVAGTAHSKSSG